MQQALRAGLRPGPWLIGDRFTLADGAVGSTCRFGVMFGAFQADSPEGDYAARCQERPALQRALAIDTQVVERLAARPGSEGSAERAGGSGD